MGEKRQLFIRRDHGKLRWSRNMRDCWTLPFKQAKLLGKENVGLYRDDGLAAINSCSGPVLDRTRKNIIALFKKEGLNVTIETNLAETDFLHVTFKLATEKYFPYRKPNNDPLYINAKSNHPPAIIKDLPKMINKRLSGLSCN